MSLPRFLGKRLRDTWHGGLSQYQNSIFVQNWQLNHAVDYIRSQVATFVAFSQIAVAVFFCHKRQKASKQDLTSLLHGGRKHIFTRWQRHKESERDHPEADGEVGQHLDSDIRNNTNLNEFQTDNIKIVKTLYIINLSWLYLRKWVILLCKVLEGHVMVHHYQHWQNTKQKK